MEAAAVTASRELVALKLVKKRKFFGGPPTLSDKDSQACKL